MIISTPNNIEFDTYGSSGHLYNQFSGEREITKTTDLARGWVFFKESKYKANVFFDTTADSTIPGIFLTLRQSYKSVHSIFSLENVSYENAITTMHPFLTDERTGCYITNNF